jgi:hypothetical protein
LEGIHAFGKHAGVQRPKAEEIVPDPRRQIEPNLRGRDVTPIDTMVYDQSMVCRLPRRAVAGGGTNQIGFVPVRQAQPDWVRSVERSKRPIGFVPSTESALHFFSPESIEFGLHLVCLGLRIHLPRKMGKRIARRFGGVARRCPWETRFMHGSKLIHREQAGLDYCNLFPVNRMAPKAPPICERATYQR